MPLPEELRRAGPLSNPVKLLSTVIVVTTVLTLLVIGTITIGAVVNIAQESAGAALAVAVILLLAGVSLPLAMWLVVLPGRREPVFYLRAFRSDAHAAPLRRLIRVALGSRYRLCGIRPPSERVSWFSRLFLNTLTGLRYIGSDHFELEASDHNWMPRLLASYAGARFVFIDVRDVTVHVADEIRLSYIAMGPSRCIFLTDSSASEPEWRQRIAGFLGDVQPDPARLLLLCHTGNSTEQDAAFVGRTLEMVRAIPAGWPDVGAAVTVAHARVPLENWPTPLWETGGGQLALGLVAANVLAIVLALAAFTSLRQASSFVSGILWLSILVLFYLFYLRALYRTWREAGFRARFRAIVGGHGPRWRPAAATGLTALAVLIPVVTIPGLLSARMTGNEVSAMSTLKALASAEVMYSVACGNGAYTDSFATLAQSDFLYVDLTNAPKAGYQFTLGSGEGSAPGPADCKGKPTVTAWYASAAPQEFGKTGRRSFATNAGSTIWQLDGSAPPREPFGPPAVPIQ